MEQLLDTVLTVEVGITALIAGGIQEAIKRSIKTADKTGKFHGGPGFSTLQSFMPMALGAVTGILVIPSGGVAEPWILGVLAGLFSSQAYNMVAPYTKSVFNKKKDDE